MEYPRKKLDFIKKYLLGFLLVTGVLNPVMAKGSTTKSFSQKSLSGNSVSSENLSGESLSGKSVSTICEVSQNNFVQRFNSLQSQYRSLWAGEVLPENQARWVNGQKQEAVYLLHGFIGSPWEMSKVAELLHQAGYTIINDLIPGYGTNGFVANLYGPKKWQDHVEANLRDVRRCFKKVHLVGFSTGGLLIHDYIRKHRKDFQAASVNLYSPFYLPHFMFADFLQKIGSILTPVVSTDFAYSLTGFPDIKVAILKPDFYLQQIPVHGAGYVTEFGESVFRKVMLRPMRDMQTNVQVFISKFDRIMDYETTKKVLESDFAQLKIVSFDEEYAPHHLMVQEVNAHANQVYHESLMFIGSH